MKYFYVITETEIAVQIYSPDLYLLLLKNPLQFGATLKSLIHSLGSLALTY